MSNNNTNIKHKNNNYLNITSVKPYQTVNEKDLDLRFKNQNCYKTERITAFQNSQNVNVFDVASYILKKQGLMSTMKLHKLLYYCQAWSLVWDEKPLFEEEIQAWTNGPVIPKLYKFHRGQFTIKGSDITIGNSDCLSQNQKESIDAVLNYYGDKSAQWLIDLTHLESPWKDSRTGFETHDRSNITISLESMYNYYSSLQNDEKTK